jgi:hypothetical protein
MDISIGYNFGIGQGQSINFLKMVYSPIDTIRTLVGYGWQSVGEIVIDSVIAGDGQVTIEGEWTLN